MRKEALQDLPTKEADEYAADCERLGAKVEKIRQSDGKWTVTAEWPDDETTEPPDAPEPARAVAFTPIESQSFLERGASHPDELGVLSRKHESNGDPGAIGWDKTGGFSYGEYQIATETGTMSRFFAYLNRQYPSFASRLEEAGGEDGARKGLTDFRSAWKALAKDPQFSKAQHNFIRVTHYEPFADNLESIGLAIRSRSEALKNVAWSVAVQHGPNNKVFANALQGFDPGTMTDNAVINAVYDERSKVDAYFPRSDSDTKKAVLQRFKAERAEALKMLAS